MNAEWYALFSGGNWSICTHHALQSPTADTETSSKKHVFGRDTTWLVNTISKRISHMPRSISATCFQKSPKTRLVNTISKRVSHMPRSISVTWKAKSAKIVLPIGVGESRKSYGSFFETKHATCLTLSRNRDADRECWPGLGLSKWTKKLLFRGKIDDRKADEGKWFNLDSTLKTFN